MTAVGLKYRFSGVFLALGIICLWTASLVLAFRYEVDFTSPVTYLWILIQTQLYTGLFITAHDAMHGTVMPGSKKVNDFFGWVCALLFAFNSYSRLYRNHHLHHRHSGGEQYPDVHRAGFFRWYYKFLANYIGWQQLVLMGIAFNILWIFLPVENVTLYWMLPAVFSTLQLFYFGTYRPHRNSPENKYRSATQRKNHLWAISNLLLFWLSL